MNDFVLTTDALHHAEIVDEPVLVATRLRELSPGLTIDLLREAIRGGLSGRNEVTRASAPTAAGIQQWLKTVEDLRTLLAEQQWYLHERQNCPFISSPDRLVTIVVMTGSGETGKCEGDDPTNQAHKGTVTRNFTAQNHQQLELFNLNRPSFDFIKKSLSEQQEGTQVWVLLYHYDTGLNEVRFELSLPTGFDKKKITAWGIRLILGSLPNHPADFTIHEDAPAAPAMVDVKIKTGTL